MAHIILFIFGLAIGSFLNVVSLRYQPRQKLLDLKIINGRSRCPHCSKELRWFELAPILSYIIQKGRCRSCGRRISFQYPLVELLSGLIFVFIPLVFFNDNFQSFNLLIFQSVVWILIFTIFLLLSIIDYYHSIIPDSINLLLAALGVVLIFIHNLYFMLHNSFLGHYALLFGFQENIWINRFFAAAISMIFIAAVIILSRGRGMGWGDFKLVGALGLIYGWPDILRILFLAFVIGAVFVTPLLLKKRKTIKDAVPFGPFLVIASVLVFFLGYQIIDGYFKLFGLY